jgi:hypothetical protein
MTMPKPEDFDAFPVGTRVRLKANSSDGKYCCCDFLVFRAGDTGTVVANGRQYLHISVKLDNITIMGKGDTWGFNPEHLEIIENCAYGRNMLEIW